jgi:hypothetical protein
MTPPAGNVLRLREDPDYAMTAAEHLEEFARLTGLEQGGWQVLLDIRDGHVTRIVADPRTVKVAMGRDELHARRRELSDADLRSSGAA